MSLNITFWHISVEHQIGIVFMGVVAKQFATVPKTDSTGCSSKIQILLMRFNNRIFYILFYFLADFLQVFKVL